MKRSTVNILASYVDALHPIIYINHFDFHVIDEAIAQLGMKAQCIEFNNALGLVNFKTKSPIQECSLEEFLKMTMDDGFEKETFLILKDIHKELNDPKIIALLKRIAENNLYIEDYNATIFIVSEVTVIPRELETYITLFDIPLPTMPEIQALIREFAAEQGITVDSDTTSELALSFKGLNEFQIRQILNLAYQDGGCIDTEDRDLILQGKEQFIKKSGMLEIIKVTGTPDDIGGLENLKDWLRHKAYIFDHLDTAIKFGVDIPKGLLIVGMPGCGKSLTAKATASLFRLPLVRLDIGRLLGKYVGDSESNLRRALKLSEAISPCVLWIDEIEKAFAGVGGGGSEVTTRLFGQFLTWMQEKESTVFIVATANNISAADDNNTVNHSNTLPPEFLRKGRFDELFFVDLPNPTERAKILEIHLKKRGKWNKSINMTELAEETEGFSGADLEAVVKDTIEAAFIDGRETITTENLQDIISQTTPIASISGNEIAKTRNEVHKRRIKPASRATQAEETAESLQTQEQETLPEAKLTYGALDWMIPYTQQPATIKLIGEALGVSMPQLMDISVLRKSSKTHSSDYVDLNTRLKDLMTDPSFTQFLDNN